MARERDLSFEKLAEVCGVDITALTPTARGALNSALKEIRTAAPDLSDDELALVIEAKAATYRKVMEGALLTPTALAKHWPNLEGLLAAQQAPVTYVTSDRSICTTCDGDRFVFAFHRNPVYTEWMDSAAKHPKAKPFPSHVVNGQGYDPERHGHEVWAPCPDCNPKGKEIVEQYLARFNRTYAGGPRLPAPVGVVQLFGTPTNTEGA